MAVMSNGNTIHLASAEKLSGSQLNLSHGSIIESTKKTKNRLAHFHVNVFIVP